MTPTGVALVLTLVVAIVLFLLIRVFWLWYWRINTVVNALQEISARLALIDQHLSPTPTVAALNEQTLELRDISARLSLIDQHLVLATTPPEAPQ